MNSSPQIESSRSPGTLVQLALLASIAAISVGLAVNPIIGFAAIGAIVMGWFIYHHPDAATVFGVFVMYANLPALAARFHGVPFVVAAATPLLFFIPLAIRVFQKQESLVFDKAVLGIFALAVVMLLSTFSMSIRPDDSFKKTLGFLLEGVVIMFLVTNVVRDYATLKATTWALVAAGALMGIAPLHQYVTKNYHNNYGGLAQLDEGDAAFMESRGISFEEADRGRYQIRLAGAIGEKNRFAQIILMVVPLGACLILNNEKPWSKCLVAGLLLAVIGGAAVTFSRGGVVGFGIAIVAACVLRFVSWRQVSVVFAVGCCVLLILPQFRERLGRLGSQFGLVPASSEDIYADSDGSIDGRVTEMRTAMAVFLKNPFLGVGPGMFGYHYEKEAAFIGGKQHAGRRRSHNLYLNIAAENGILGLMVFLSAVGVVGHRLYRAHRLSVDRRPDLARFAAAYCLAILIYLSTGIFLHFAYVRFFCMFAAIAAAAGHITIEEALASEPDERSFP